jgi:hypothetical protein
VTAGRAVVIDGATPGYPRDSLSQIPAGDYYVQAVLNIYETFHRASGASAGGRTLKLPMDQGEGQHWNRKPGNLYSEPAKVHVDPASTAVVRIELTKTIAAIEPPKDTKFIKHVRIESKLLSAFWGRPMYLGAVVLLPDGFDEHPNAHYPTLYYQGHYQATFTGSARSLRLRAAAVDAADEAAASTHTSCIRIGPAAGCRACSSSSRRTPTRSMTIPTR